MGDGQLQDCPFFLLRITGQDLGILNTVGTVVKNPLSPHWIGNL